MSDNFRRETAGSKAGHSETGRSLSLSVELAEHFKQSMAFGKLSAFGLGFAFGV